MMRRQLRARMVREIDRLYAGVCCRCQGDSRRVDGAVRWTGRRRGWNAKSNAPSHGSEFRTTQLSIGIG